MTMQGGTARDRLRARAQAMYGGKRREDEEQQNRQNQRQEAETPAVGSARDRLRQRASAMGVVTGQGEGESITMPERKTTWTDKVRSGGRTGNYTTAASTPEQQESVLRKGLSGKQLQRTDAEQVESLLRKGGTTEAVKASKKTGGKFDVGDYSKLLGESFAQGVAEGTAGTLAAGETLIGKGLDKLFPGAGFEGSGFFNALYNGRPDWKFFGENGLVGIRQSREYTQQKLAEDVEDIETGSELGTKVAKKAASFGGDVAYGMGNALPMAAEAVITGGTSLLPTTTKELETLGINVVQKSGLAGKLEEAAKLAGNTLRSREYWTSFFSEVGMDYYEALDNGATDDEATRYALSSALVNSVIEIGGGIQKIPEAPTFRTWIKGAHEEGMEEIQQGIVSRLMENAVYDKKNPLVSVTDENAVVNPVTAANEYAGGFAVGGLLGGVQQGMAKRAQTRQEAELAQYQESLDKLGEEFTPAAKEMAQERLSLDSEDYTAQKVMNALDSGEAVSGEDIRTLIRDNVNAHNTAALAEIKEKIAQRLTDLGETKDANAVADAMVRYFTGETRGKDKASRKQRAADQDTIFRSRYGDHVGQELMQTKNVPQWVQGLPSLTTVYEYEQAHRPVAEQQTVTETPAAQETETSVEQGAETTEQSAEPVKLTSAIVRKAAASRETLEQLGIDPKGKTGSQLRAEVRQALTERQAAAQEVQQRTQVTQQTHQTQEAAQQTQGEPVTLEEASKAYGNQAKAFLRTYQQGQDVEKFSEAYRIAHEMGQSNVPYRVVQGLRSLDYLTEAQKDIAYRTGASAEQQERGGRKATWRKQGVVRAENGAKLSDLSKTFNVPQKQGYKILSDIAKATGVDIVLYRSKGDAEGNITEAEGRFRRSENTIYIDVNSGIDNVNSSADFSQYTMLRTFNHEFTHFIEQNAAEEYRELRKLVFEAMQEKLDGQEGGVTVDDLIREKQDKYRQALGQDISYDEASREVVADAMTDILPDSHFMETLYNRNATLAEKLIGKLKDFIAKVKAYFDGLTTNTKAEAALLKEMRDGGLHYLEGIVEAYDKAATAAVENYQGAETRSEGGEDQYMARGKYWRPQLKRAEWELLERRMNAEIKSGENFLDEATKWVYADEKGVQVFALYGIGDGTEATPLYAVGGKKAAACKTDITDYVEGRKNADRNGQSADLWIKQFQSKKRSRGRNLSEAQEQTGTAGTADELYGGQQGRNLGGYSERSTENQRGVKDQFLLRDPMEETRDLLALHNMTADNLRGALKLGGLPMPSIAIVKAAAGHSKYGPISVVFEKSTIDPQADRRNKVYGGDAYTPTAPKVEYPVNDRAMRKVEKHLAELSGQVAGGIFLNDTALRRLGIEDESSMNADALAERLARDDSVQAAYLADSGKALEPVRQPKEFSKFGNGALQQLVFDVGVQELARINAEMQTGNYAAVREIEGTIRDIIRSTYEVQHRGFLDRKPELKQKRIAHYMENNVNIRTVEDFARDAWNFYQDNGATTDEIDRWATADKLHEMVTQDQVKAWLRPQLEGLLGEAGIYNGKERYTSSGNQRSFSQTHYAYTLENIVRAMAETQKERGGQTFGVTAKTMQAVSTPSYDSIAAIKADSGRLGAVEGEAYDAAVQKVETQIEQAIRKVMRENKPHSDNQFDEMEIIGEVMMEAAKGTKTEAAIQRAFQKEDYTISKETAKMVQKLFRDAAALPTEYFEAKLQRAVPFNEAAAVVVPDDLPAGLKKGLEDLGATVREYKAGDEQSRLEAVNAIPDVQFSIREIAGKAMPVLDTQKDTRDYKVAEAYLKTLVDTEHPFSTILMDAQPVYIGRDLPGEYRSSEYTKTLRKAIRDVKMQAATNLDEMLLLAENGEWHENIKEKHKVDAKNGWYRYSTQFAVPVLDIKKSVDHYTVYSGTLLIRNDADGKSYLYDLLDIKKEKVISSASFSARGHSEVFEPKPSQTQYTQNQTESQAQIRSSTLSDRDVLRIAAQMAKNSESRSLTDADRARLGIIEQKLGRIDEAEEQRQGFLEEKRAILAGREAKELSDAERAQLRKVQKNLDTVNGKIRLLNEELLQTQEKKVVKELLKKARVVVERDAVQRGVARLNEYKNRRSAAELRTSIKKTAKAFQQMLLHPTGTKYAPENLIQSCFDVATMLDTSGEREDTKAKAQYRSMMDALNTLKTQYDELKDNPDSDFRGEYDTNFAYMVEQLAKRIGGKPVRDLTLTELQDVHSVLRDIQTMLRNAKYQIGQAERITNYAVGESIIRDMEKIPERTVAERAMDTTSRLTISTLRNIRRLTMYNDNSQLVRLFDALNDGIKKKNRFMMECDKLFERFLGKRFRKAAGLIKSYNVGTRTFKMTEMEAIQLVLTWEREAHGETSHLAKGGFIIPNHYLLKKGKFKDAFLKGTTYSHVQQSEIDAIQRTFDKWALDYKAAVKNEFFNGIAKNAINNTTFQLKGRAVALTPDYVAMEVDKNSVVTELEGVKFDATIEGMGMLKSVVKGASNPVIIRGVHSLVESHIERVGQLYGLAIPIRNFNKAYNVKTVDGTSSVRGAIGKTWSAADLEMIEQAISDLQTPRKRADVFDKMVRKATSSFVKAKLLSNISVTIKQAASYSTAGLYLSQKALFPYQTTVVGLFVSNKSKFAKKLFAEIDEHTAEHYIRRKGMSMQEINTIAKDNSKIVRDMDENLPDAANPLKWIQNMDVATTAALWLATKKQVALDGMKTTDPGYWDAVTSLYEKVIEETQPMYDTLHRPEVQKTPNEIVRGVLMFRTQPLQNTGILYDAFGELNQAVKSKDAEWVKRARKKAAMAVGSQLASLAVFSVMTMLAGVAKNRLYRYLNDEDELTIQSIMLRVLGDMATNGAGLLIPIGGSELAELVEKHVTGSSYGGEFSVSVVDMLNDYIDQFGKCWKDVADLNDGGREKLPTDLRDLSMDTAGLFGIPAENVFNIIRGVVGNISDTFSEEPIQWATDIPDPNVSAIKAAFDNGHMDTAKDKIVELIAFKVKSGKTEKEAASSVRSSITSYYKPLYLKALRNGDKEEMRRIASIIKASGLYSEGADATLEKWASAAD